MAVGGDGSQETRSGNECSERKGLYDRQPGERKQAVPPPRTASVRRGT